jgi:hypothetical protein
VTDTPRRRSLLMHDDQNRRQHRAIMSGNATGFNARHARLKHDPEKCAAVFGKIMLKQEARVG